MEDTRGCESQAPGKDRRTEADVAERAHDRMAGHAPARRLGRLYRERKLLREVYPGARHVRADRPRSRSSPRARLRGPRRSGERSCGRRPPETELPGASSASAAAGSGGSLADPRRLRARRHSRARWWGASDTGSPGPGDGRAAGLAAGSRAGRRDPRPASSPGDPGRAIAEGRAESLGRVWRRLTGAPENPAAPRAGRPQTRRRLELRRQLTGETRRARTEGGGNEDPPGSGAFQRRAQVAGSRSASCCVLRALQATRSRPSRLAR